jgi:hypothetical protein
VAVRYFEHEVPVTVAREDHVEIAFFNVPQDDVPEVFK